ncbi:MAG: SAM-dependent methyltransferase, partial [Burkholderiales bacterium]|nr:SAM-dependent methyltransferase [Burkholderiales bacterium]
HRAAHQLLESPRVFDDPLALRVLGADEVRRLALEADRYRAPAARALRAFIVARSRLAEDELARAVAEGVRQYVVLGAGLDTFAWRNPYPGLRVFEVDHPATQTWKRRHLATLGIDAARGLTWAPVDFEREALGAALARAGFRDAEPAFFSWLGVTIYLSREAVFGTLREIARLARGTRVVFDFSPPRETLPEEERRAHEALAARVARLGEPWIGYFEPETLAAEMRALGFASAEHAGTAELNARYFSGRADGFRLSGSGRLMSARV